MCTRVAAQENTAFVIRIPLKPLTTRVLSSFSSSLGFQIKSLLSSWSEWCVLCWRYPRNKQ